MKPKELKIGEEIQLGNIKLKCVKNADCTGCYFNEMTVCASVNIVGVCSSIDREDKTSVIFVRVEE